MNVLLARGGHRSFFVAFSGPPAPAWTSTAPVAGWPLHRRRAAAAALPATALEVEIPLGGFRLQRGATGRC
jgi:hypothetical protein